MTHGTISAYKCAGCRCELCRQRNAEVERNRQARKRRAGRGSDGPNT